MGQALVLSSGLDTARLARRHLTVWLSGHHSSVYRAEGRCFSRQKDRPWSSLLPLAGRFLLTGAFITQPYYYVASIPHCLLCRCYVRLQHQWTALIPLSSPAEGARLSPNIATCHYPRDQVGEGESLAKPPHLVGLAGLTEMPEDGKQYIRGVDLPSLTIFSSSSSSSSPS